PKKRQEDRGNSLAHVFLPPNSISQTELNPHAGREIDRLAVALGRFELDLLCRARSRLIEPVTQAAHDAVDRHLSGSQENDLESDVAFDSLLTPLGGIFRTRFLQNVNRGGRAFGRSGLLLGRLRDSRCCVGEACGLHGTATLRGRRGNGNAVAKSCARPSPAGAACPTPTLRAAGTAWTERRARFAYRLPIIRD